MQIPKLKSILVLTGIQGAIFLLISLLQSSTSSLSEESVLTEEIHRRSFSIEVHTTGELEAARSTAIASTIPGDLAKVIYLAADGTNAKTGDPLVRIDPAPFEKFVQEKDSGLKECVYKIAALEELLSWETYQAEHEEKAAAFDTEAAQFEFNKIVYGDGPLEETRLKSLMLKAKTRYEEIKYYVEDLLNLEDEGFLNRAELKQAQRKLQEEQEAYETAKLQYESFIKYIHPMQLKKAETTLKRLTNKQEEIAKSTGFKIGKAKGTLELAKQELNDWERQCEEAKRLLSMTEIKAPTPGMVVLREEFRSGQRRKPRVGDILVKNQPILDLPDLSSMVVKTKVREIDLYKIQPGKSALIQVDAYPHLIFPGKVTSIGVLALADVARPGEEKYFEVKIAMNEGDERLRPGMTARISIFADHIENALVIPVHAVFEKDKKPFCYLAHGNAFRLQPLKLGLSNEAWVHVLSGIQENDRVALAKPPDQEVIP